MSCLSRRGFALFVIGAFGFVGSVSAASDPPVSGVFKGDGKEAKLAFISASKGEPHADKPTFVIVMTEKDHSKEKKPWIKAGFGHYGSALILTIHPDGKIVGFEVAHTAHRKGTFSSLGNVTMSDFKNADGRLSGKIATNGEMKTFGQTWEVNIKFNVKAP